jgi:hypothetical protein
MKTLRQSAPIITSLGIACLWLVLATPAFAQASAQFHDLAREWSHADQAIERVMDRDGKTPALVQQRAALNMAYTKRALALIGKRTITAHPYIDSWQKAKSGQALTWMEGTRLLHYVGDNL